MDEQVLEAELANSLPVDKPNSTNSLNAAIGATIAVVLVFLMLSRTIGTPLEEQAIEKILDVEDDNTKAIKFSFKSIVKNTVRDRVLSGGARLD